MRIGAALLIGVTAAIGVWFAILYLWSYAAEYLVRQMGMGGGGDVGSPWVALIGGSFLGLALILIIVGALIGGNAQRLVTIGGASLAVMSEWMLASYLNRLQRFISAEYDSLPPPRPVPLVDDATYLGQSAVVIGLHVAAVAAMIVLLFLLVSAVKSGHATKANVVQDV